MDLALAAAAVALNVSTLISFDQRAPLDAPGWWLAVLHSAPIAVRRRLPTAAFATSAAAGLAFLALGYPMVILGVTALLMVYTLAAERPPRVSVTGLAVACVGMVVALVVAESDMGASTIAGNVVVLGAMWLIGDSTRRRRQQAEAERVALARQAVAEERISIARELHDVVAHSMSVVGVQAGLARIAIDDDPRRAKESLAIIEKAGRQAMDEMRRLLHVLRDGSENSATLAPAPGLAHVDELVSHTALAGTRVDLVEQGRRRVLAPGLDLTAFRVLQEALTNVRRHAPGMQARVAIDYQDDELVLRIDNDVVDGSLRSDNGHGLTGMQERVELYHGALEYGLHPDGVFRIVARLPYEPGDQ